MSRALLIAVNSQYSHSSLALRYLREYAGSRIFECSVNDSIFDIYARLSKRPESIFCFSVYIWNVEYIKRLAPMLVTARPEITILFAGPEAGYQSQSLLETLWYLSGVIIGEGEEATKAIEQGLPYDQIPNFAWRDGSVVRQNPVTHTDLSRVPFPYREEDLNDLKNKIIYFESSRGCLYQCSYCLSSSEGKTRVFPMEYVYSGLYFFMNHRVKLVKFVDRTFNENQQRACQIAQFIVDHNQCTRFHFEISPQLLTQEFLDIVEQANGMIQFEMGIQTTNRKTMKEIRRIYDPDKTKDLILRIPSNVHTHLDLIAGLPYETLETFQDGFRYVYSMKPQMLQLGFLKLLHHTKLKQDAQQYQIKTTEFPPYEVLSTSTMSAQDIIFLKNMEKALDRIYNSGAFRHTLEALDDQDPFDLFFKLGQALSEQEAQGPISRIGLYEFVYQMFGDSIKKALTVDFLESNHKAPLPACLIDDCPNLKQLHHRLLQLPQYQEKKVRLVAAAHSFFAVYNHQVEEVTSVIKSF